MAVKGSKNHKAKLTEAQVLAARRLTRMRQVIPTIKDMAHHFGVAPRVLEAAVDGSNWRHVQRPTQEDIRCQLALVFPQDFRVLP